jgi:gamma-carbonic anhydrase
VEKRSTLRWVRFPLLLIYEYCPYFIHRTALDGLGKTMEVTKYTERLVPSTRFVSVNGVAPKVDAMSFVAPSASVIGDVTMGKESSVWYGAVLRGDVNTITIGNQSSIGDRAVVHVAKIQGDFPTHIGDHVTIGAGALVHAATVKDAVLIGESAQVLDGAVVESHSIIAPAAIVTPGTKVASGQLWAGSPAKMVRSLTEEEIAGITARAMETVLLASQHAEENAKGYEQILEEKEVADILRVQDGSYPVEPPHPSSEGDVLGQGAPGRIFRSSLSHPEEALKERLKTKE